MLPIKALSDPKTLKGFLDPLMNYGRRPDEQETQMRTLKRDHLVHISHFALLHFNFHKI